MKNHFPVIRQKKTKQCLTSRSSRSEEHTSELQSRQYLVCRLLLEKKTTRLLLMVFEHALGLHRAAQRFREGQRLHLLRDVENLQSTRLNSINSNISHAFFCFIREN